MAFIDKQMLLGKNLKKILHIIIKTQYLQLLDDFPKKVVLITTIPFYKKLSFTTLRNFL